jgi:hypothetical protein
MASASRESVFGVQTNTARKIHRSDRIEGRLTTAPSGCYVRKGSPNGTAVVPLPIPRQFRAPDRHVSNQTAAASTGTPRRRRRDLGQTFGSAYPRWRRSSARTSATAPEMVQLSGLIPERTV